MLSEDVPNAQRGFFEAQPLGLAICCPGSLSIKTKSNHDTRCSQTGICSLATKPRI